MDIYEMYFDWMASVAILNEAKRYRYSRLLGELNNTPFEYTNRMDENRYQDGIDIRYRFGYEHDIDELTIQDYLDIRIPSLLEVLVALIIRADGDILNDPEIGPQTERIFMDILVSLGLDDMTNENFDSHRFSEVIDRLNNRQYNYDGKGGLFTLRNPRADMRETEIWYQLLWYINEMLAVN